MSIPTKWQKFDTSIFSTMTQLADAASAINLAQGFPDFDGPEAIREAAVAAIRGSRNQYAPSAGLPKLRELLALRQRQRYRLDYDPVDEVTVYSGATEAIFCALQALLEPGDEVIALEPFYDSYAAAAFAAGAKLVGVALRPPAFRLDAADLAAAWTPRTRALMINTPHNPTGRVLSPSELQTLRDFAVERALTVITDEVYEELVFPPHRHQPLATLPGMRERTALISSTSKTYSLTGWKVGYCFAPTAITRAMRTVHQFTVFCSATPLQQAMTVALELPDNYYSDLRAAYQAKRDQLSTALQAAGFGLAPAEGTYFLLADYSGCCDISDIEFCRWLTTDVKVAAIPISGFFSDPVAAATLRYARFAFCKSAETLRAAGERLATAFPNAAATPMGTLGR